MSKMTMLAVIACLAGGWFLAANVPIEAAAPWETLLSHNRVEANPNKSYQLTEQNGPWLIMASSFSGEGAEEQARELVLELRKRYKLPAYMHQMQIDFDKDTGGRGIDKNGRPKVWRYRRGNKADEICVLVGDYPSIDDVEAQQVLEKIKHSTPDCLKIEKGKQTHQTLIGLRTVHKKVLAKVNPNNPKAEKGPMGQAFMTQNPLLDNETTTKSLDPLVVKMNKDLPYSLLKCPGKYTVQVAHFTGKVIVDQTAIKEIEHGQRQLKETLLDQAAEKAHALTVALREKGFEAYELHDRQVSIVTIGSFNSYGTPRPDGRTEINPQIHRIMETFKGKRAPTGQLASQLVIDIPLDIQPEIVAVPRESIGGVYARHSSGLFR
ncbi:MAG: hypothetical protein JW741_07955 [Sedimentisphaerales bacterium]|nr:hypothetical protein [Sedimentisphaerales bacterium]